MNRNSHAYHPIMVDSAADNRQHLGKGLAQGQTMIGGLDDLMRFQSEALRLRSYRQELLSANVAHADTPNYKVVDFDFATALQNATRSAAAASGSAAAPQLLYRMPSQASIDGNSVEMDAERAKFADNTLRYEAAMRYLSAQIKTMLAAIQS